MAQSCAKWRITFHHEERINIYWIKVLHAYSHTLLWSSLFLLCLTCLTISADFLMNCVESVRMCACVHMQRNTCVWGGRMRITFVMFQSSYHACMQLTRSEVARFSKKIHKKIIVRNFVLPIAGGSGERWLIVSFLSLTAMARTSSLHPSHRFWLLYARSGITSYRSQMYRRTSE